MYFFLIEKSFFLSKNLNFSVCLRAVFSIRNTNLLIQDCSEEFESEEEFSLKTVLVRSGIVAATVAVVGGIAWVGITAHNNAKEKRVYCKKLL